VTEFLEGEMFWVGEIGVDHDERVKLFSLVIRESLQTDLGFFDRLRIERDRNVRIEDRSCIRGRARLTWEGKR